MKKKLIVKQKNMQTNEELILADCSCDVFEENGVCHFSYQEKQPLNGVVEVRVEGNHLSIERKGESHSTLYFDPKMRTKGQVESIYGVMEIELYTHVLGRLQDSIALEYDVCNDGQVLESYRFIFRFKNIA